MKIISKISLLAALCLATGPLAAQTTIGYSNGYVNRTQGKRFGAAPVQGMAIRISKEKAQLLKGTQIKAFEAAHSTSHTQNLTFFITNDLQGNPVYTQIEKKSSTRWKKYNLNTPYTITGEEFYIGYTCEVTDTYKPHLFDESKDLGNALAWALNEGKWEDISHMGFGAPNLRIVLADNKPFTDLTIKPVQASGFLKVGNAYSFGGQLFNFGSEPVKSFDLVCRMGESEPMTYHIDNINIESGATYDFSTPAYTPSSNGEMPFEVTVENINNQVSEADASDNHSVTTTYIYPEDITKKVLVEGFTGQACSNCPNGHKALQEELAGLEDQFIEISHHAGYQIDAFTMKEDMEYTWFYNNNGSTYAPAVMFNRTRVYDNLPSVVFETQDRDLLRAAIAKFSATQPYVSISLDNQYDAATRNNKITVKVYTHVLPSNEEHRLNLCLTQNGIQSYQSGATSSYVHNHVFRGNINGTWGEQIDLIPGDTIVKTYEYTLPETIESTQSHAKIPTSAKDMNLVAFVSDATTSALTCSVYNAASIKMVQDEISGITSPQSEHQTMVSICGNRVHLDGSYTKAILFNNLGQQIGYVPSSGDITLNKGLYIVNVLHDNGETETHKIYIAK